MDYSAWMPDYFLIFKRKMGDDRWLCQFQGNDTELNRWFYLPPASYLGQVMKVWLPHYIITWGPFTNMV